MSSEVKTWQIRERSLGEIVAEIKSEFKTFVVTRVDMLKEELRENAKSLKIAAPMFGMAVAFLTVSCLFFGVCLVALVEVAFIGNPYGWFFAFLIIAFLFAVVGGITAYVAMGTLRDRNLYPKKTLKVLHDDKVWWDSEVRRSA